MSFCFHRSCALAEQSHIFFSCVEQEENAMGGVFVVLSPSHVLWECFFPVFLTLCLLAWLTVLEEDYTGAYMQLCIAREQQANPWME